MSIEELKEFLSKLPKSFDKFSLVNGEKGELDDEMVYRIDKPILSIIVDEETKELCFFHQTNDEIELE